MIVIAPESVSGLEPKIHQSSPSSMAWHNHNTNQIHPEPSPRASLAPRHSGRSRSPSPSQSIGSALGLYEQGGSRTDHIFESEGLALHITVAMGYTTYDCLVFNSSRLAWKVFFTSSCPLTFHRVNEDTNWPRGVSWGRCWISILSRRDFSWTRPGVVPDRVFSGFSLRPVSVCLAGSSVQVCQEIILKGPRSLRPTQTLSSIDGLSATPSNLRRCSQLSMISFRCLADNVSHGSPGHDFDCLT